MKTLLFSLLLLIPLGVYSQAENNNWYFGWRDGINFASGSPVTLLDNPSPQYTSGSGTISNKVTGEMLFTTDGKDVWNKNFSQMPNAVTPPINDYPSLQSRLVVPSIANRNQYYVFSTGYGGQFFNYSVVDMTLDGNLGDIVPTQKRVDMYDENGNLFTALSGALTVAKNDSGDAYWVLYSTLNKLYAYKIDSAGLHNPVVTTLTFTYNLGYQGSYLNLLYMKVSPDNAKVAINVSAIPTLEPQSQMRIYNFNAATGTVNTSGGVINRDALGIRDFEFSPGSNLLFYSSVNDPNICIGCYTSKVCCYDLVNATTREIYNGDGDYYYYFQRTPNADLYFCKNNVQRYISKFVNPNDYNTAISNNFLDTNPDYPTVIRYCKQFPQLVPLLDCALYEDLKGNNINASYNYQVSDRITTSAGYTVNNAQKIHLNAGNYIAIKADTHIKNGAMFLAKIQGCPASPNRMANLQDDHLPEQKAVASANVLVYPNPVKSTTKVLVQNARIKSLTVRSLTDEKPVYEDREATGSQADIDLSALDKGVYILLVITDDGQTLSCKIIKD